MKIAIVGATGLVGGVILKVLEEKGFDGCDIIAAASLKSVGKTVMFAGRQITVVSVEDAIQQTPDFAIFSAGGATSLCYAPKFAEVGTTVIDNSSAWRNDPKVPLVVPEINITVVSENDRIIANPNCSTVQMVLALSRLHAKYRIKRIVVSTYQSVTGSGVKGINQLNNEAHSLSVQNPAYPHPIHRNLIPHGGDFLTTGYTTEEQKLVDETRKIFGDPDIQITATVVRVPVEGGHSESVNVEFVNEYELSDAIDALASTPGVKVVDNPQSSEYPMPLYAQGRDEVFVGRIRRDMSQPCTLNMWVVSDNLRKGAATNAVQILESLSKRNNYCI